VGLRGVLDQRLLRNLRILKLGVDLFAENYN
jgi:hypothetical protein